jgi:hypothetical protein
MWISSTAFSPTIAMRTAERLDTALPLQPAGHCRISLFRAGARNCLDENQSCFPFATYIRQPAFDVAGHDSVAGVALTVPWFLPLKIQTIKTHSYRRRLVMACYFSPAFSGNAG